MINLNILYREYGEPMSQCAWPPLMCGLIVYHGKVNLLIPSEFENKKNQLAEKWFSHRKKGLEKQLFNSMHLSMNKTECCEKISMRVSKSKYM